MSELPVGWGPCQLGEILELKYGKALLATSRDGGAYPVYGSNGIVGNHSTYLAEGPTVIVGRKGSVGEVCYSAVPCSPIDTTYYVDEFEVTHSKFIYYLLRNLDLASLNKSTAIPGLNRQDAYDLEIPLAPLAEQKRIAQKLDALLAQVDTLKARIDAIPALLKRFRKSVVHSAVIGRLSADLRVPIGKSEEQEQLGPLESWREVTLASLGELSRGKSKHRPRNDSRLYGSAYPFIQTGDVANSGGALTSSKVFYSEFGLKQSRLFPSGTLCITIAANIADTAMLAIDACFPDSVVGFIPNKDDCIAQFIKYVIDDNKESLEALAPATAQKNINLKVLNQVKLRIPPIKEQIEIVRRVEQLFAYADQLEAKVTAAQQRIDALTQSLLAKAFRGELVPQDPSDEPASALLERIRAQRAAAPKPKRGRKAATS
ncbi:restriction endonuclease subunit S [Xanthomonas sp. LMG 12461]|uniref:restriction endonuclease subunit S n=1 Tax=Xanthomonas sp. LMG 12461 TaxID=2014543 RepID=UPI001264B22E|nr:restriction endonuclease subunit S [Xanthomonas sp. LMG 12461]KAB7771576.1 restriction endonuclease subunit S [Xanthomonas sp. LMG 12461]